MGAAPQPDDENDRLAVLRSFEILDCDPSDVFDRYTRLAAKILNVPMSAISLVDEARQWFLSHQGLSVRETPREWAFCAYTILGHKPLVVADPLQDPRFVDNPLVRERPRIRFYAGAPLATRDHHNIGALCIIDDTPRPTLTPREVEILQDLADAVVNELYLHKATLDLCRAEIEHARLAAIVASSEDAIISKTNQGLISSWNRAAEKIFGYPAEEVLGKPLTLLLPPERAAEEEGILARLQRGESIEPWEAPCIRKDGQSIMISATLSSIVDGSGQIVGVSKIARDISDRVRADRLLFDRQERLSAILNTVVDGIITIDHAGTVETFNPAAAKIFGYTADAVIGHNIKMLMPEPYFSEHDGYLSRYTETGIARVIGVGREVVGLRQDGTVFPMELVVSRMDVSGRRMFTGVVRDISDRKQAERQKAEFISTISHELRTPLTAIRGALSLVNCGVMGKLPDDAHALTVIAEESCERLVRLINDILDVEKISLGQLQLDIKPMSLTQAVERSIADNRAYSDLFHVILRAEYAGTSYSGTSAQIIADFDRVVQILTNLISNACKFSPPGGEVLVQVSAPAAGWIKVAVQDHGPGIPAEFRPRIFGKFAQADGSDSKAKGGTGLGLNITKSLVERMRGTIGFDSEPGHGCVFYVIFPLVESLGGEASLGEPQRSRVLIVQDEPAAAQTLADVLDCAGFAVVVVPTLDVAAQRLAEGSFVAAVLCRCLAEAAVGMFLQGLRRSAATRTLSVIMMAEGSGVLQASLAGESFDVVDWIGNPEDKARLVEAVRRASGADRDVDPRVSGGNPGKVRILHVEDDALLRALVAHLLVDLGTVIGTDTVAGALELATAHPFDLAILDLGLPDGCGLEVIPHLSRQDGARTPVVVFSAADISRDRGRDRGVGPTIDAQLVKSRGTDADLVRVVRTLIYRQPGFIASRDLSPAGRKSLPGFLMIESQGARSFGRGAFGMTDDGIDG